MNAEQTRFYNHLLSLAGDPEALIAAAMEEHTARVEAENKLHEVSKGQTALSKEHQRVKKERDEAVKEKNRLDAVVKKLVAQLNERNRDCFGRRSEKADAMAGAASETNEDPLSEDSPPDSTSRPSNFIQAAAMLAGGKGGPGKGGTGGNGSNDDGKRGKKGKGKRASALARYPHRDNFDIDIDKLNAMYGVGNWEILNFHTHVAIRHKSEVYYVYTLYRPVVKLRDGQIIAPEMPIFYPHSLLSASLLSDIFTKRFALYLPIYRMMHSTGLGDLPVTDTTIYNWIIHFSMEYLGPIYDYLVFLMMGVVYHQCDETTWMVIRDGRKAGSKGYMWIHTTSELWDKFKIVVAEFELTRGTDHLRKFYRFFKGNIGSDAFAAYLLLEKENPDDITISGCMMHVRRRFFFAFLILCNAINSEDIAVESLEAKAISLISEIYNAETPLKALSADERHTRRQAEVRPLVDKFYDFVREQNLTDPLLSDKMRDALSYALNHEREIRRFLDDGFIAMDNGYCERSIKPIALARRNSLFSTCLDGAKSTAIATSIVETAKANGAIPYYYFKYIFEEMPKYLDGKDRSFLADFVPWSDKYRAYEARERLKSPDVIFKESQETPWKFLKHLRTQRDCA